MLGTMSITQVSGNQVEKLEFHLYNSGENYEFSEKYSPGISFFLFDFRIIQVLLNREVSHASFRFKSFALSLSKINGRQPLKEEIRDLEPPRI